MKKSGEIDGFSTGGEEEEEEMTTRADVVLDEAVRNVIGDSIVGKQTIH